MSQAGPFLGFSLRDTLTRLIPGLIFLAPLAIGIAAFMPDLFPNGPLLYILLGLSAYLLGEFIDQLRLGLFRVPLAFRYFVHKETDQIEKMPSWYVRLVEFQEKLPNKLNFYEDIDEDKRLVNNLELAFRRDIESELGVDFVDNRPREIYDLLLIYMDDHHTSRLRRLQSVSIFSSNLRIAAAGTLILYSVYAIFNWGDPFFLSILGVSILITVLVVFFWTALTMAQYQYAELLFKEYYMKRLKDQRD